MPHQAKYFLLRMPYFHIPHTEMLPVIAVPIRDVFHIFRQKSRLENRSYALSAAGGPLSSTVFPSGSWTYIDGPFPSAP